MALTNPTGSGVVVKPLEPDTLVDVASWEKVWTDNGSRKPLNFSLWRGVASSADYVVVGGFFVASSDPWYPPSPELTQGVKAVHRSVLLTAAYGREVWNDHGTGAGPNGAVWNTSVVGFVDALDTGAFVPVEGYNNPPRLVYALDRSKIEPTS